MQTPMPTVAALAALAALSSGCGAMIEGNRQLSGVGEATYILESTSPDGRSCRVTAASGREFGRAKVSIGDNCTLEVDAEKLTGGEMQAAYQAMVDRVLQALVLTRTP
jgi:hypothetical protein